MDSFFPIFEKQQFYGSEKVYKNLDRVNIYIFGYLKNSALSKNGFKGSFLISRFDFVYLFNSESYEEINFHDNWKSLEI